MNRIFPGQCEHQPDHVFRRGEGFGLWTLSLLVRGTMAVAIDGREVVCRGPHLMLVKPGTSYVARFLGRRIRPYEYWAIFEPVAADKQLLAWPAAVAGDDRLMMLSLTSREIEEACVRAMQDICFDHARPWHGRDALMTHSLHRLLLLAAQFNPRARQAVRDERIAQAMAILAARLDAPMAVAELARAVHLSPSRLAHLFRQTVGCAPAAWHEQRRLGHAQNLLLSSAATISEIARQTGYENAFHFSTRFRKYAGVSPSAFRKGATTQL